MLEGKDSCCSAMRIKVRKKISAWPGILFKQHFDMNMKWCRSSIYMLTLSWSAVSANHLILNESLLVMKYLESINAAGFLSPIAQRISHSKQPNIFVSKLSHFIANFYKCVTIDASILQKLETKRKMIDKMCEIFKCMFMYVQVQDILKETAWYGFTFLSKRYLYPRRQCLRFNGFKYAQMKKWFPSKWSWFHFISPHFISFNYSIEKLNPVGDALKASSAFQ